ncbi:MAG: GntR family transcriptional regulator [Pseudorhodoplanes sp.]|nr:GntR family transcriptional regulator [Pseudorhodoplanes sp.]
MSDLLSSRVAVQSLVDAVAERLEAAIVSGDLPPGSKLSEQALAQSLGVSRGPLREAIRRLEGRKLVHRTPNVGVRIAELSTKDLTDLLIVREALEGIACRAAAENMTDAEIVALGELLTVHSKHKMFQTGVGYYQEAEDFDFHFRIVKASRNDRLIAMLCEDLYHLLRVYRYKSSTRRGRAKQALAEHKKIVRALARRDPDLAEQRMREHIRNARIHVVNEVSANEADGLLQDEKASTTLVSLPIARLATRKRR